MYSKQAKRVFTLVLLAAFGAAPASADWTAVVLTPAGAGVSEGLAVSGDQEVGYADVGGAYHAACGAGARQAGWTSTPLGRPSRKPWPSPAVSRWGTQARTLAYGVERRQAGWTSTPPGRSRREP